MKKILIATMISFTVTILAYEVDDVINENDAYSIDLEECNQPLVKIIIKKLDLLSTHGEYLLSRNEALFRFKQLLEDEGGKDWNVSDTRYIELIYQAAFPENNVMTNELKKLSSDIYVGYKAKYALEIIKEGMSGELSTLFELLSKEISNDVDNYVGLNTDLSKYKSKLEDYYLISNGLMNF